MANHTAKPIAKPAKPVSALLSQLPTPVGGVVIENPSPSEKRELRRMGVEDAKKLPSNFAEISQQAARLATTESDDDIPLPVPAGTKPLEVNAVDISTLPKDQQDKYQRLIQASLQQMEQMMASDAPSGMERSVAAAVAAGSAPMPTVPDQSVVDDTKATTYATGAPKEDLKAAEDSDQAASGNCSRCGFPKHLVDDVEMDAFDSEVYFDAIMAGVPFQKTYQRYNGRLVIVVRGLRVEELDAIRRQLQMDQKAGLCQSDLDVRVRAEQLQNCLQLVRIGGKEKDSDNYKDLIVCPQSLEEWGKTPGEVHKALCHDDALKTATLYRTVAMAINQFNALEHKLEQMSRDPSFCKAGN